MEKSIPSINQKPLKHVRKNVKGRGEVSWKDDWIVKSVYYSYRGPELGSQNHHQVTHNHL